MNSTYVEISIKPDIYGNVPSNYFCKFEIDSPLSQEDDSQLYIDWKIDVKRLNFKADSAPADKFEIIQTESNSKPEGYTRNFTDDVL